MAKGGSAATGEMWPRPRFHFEVRFDEMVLSFEEVSGLRVEEPTLEYRGGQGQVFAHVKMPGLQKTGRVTMKKGRVQGDDQLPSWMKDLQMDVARRRTVTISLLEEDGQATMVWTLAKAWPTKITVADMNAQGDDMAIESIEFAHEGLAISQR